MQLINQQILDAANSRQAQEPVVFVDIFADNAERQAIDSETQWIGTFDPMKASDLNVSFSRIKGAVTLSDGASVAAVGSTPLIYPQYWSMNGNVRSKWSNVGGWVNSNFVHDGYTKTITLQQNEKVMNFDATATIIVESIIITCSYSGNMGPRTCYCYIVDSAGVQVGNRVSFTPALSTTELLINGLAASVSKGQAYRIIIGFNPFSISELPDTGFVSLTQFNFSLILIPTHVASAVWFVQDTAQPWGAAGQSGIKGYGFSLGGIEGYAHNGTLIRQFNMGSIPITDGYISFTDTVPALTTQTITLYFTDSDIFSIEASLTNWTLFGVVKSGDTIPAHKYWRAAIDMVANTANDTAPSLERIEITYQASVTTFGTHASSMLTIKEPLYHVPWSIPLTSIISTDKRISGIKAIDSISTASAQLSPKLSASMIGSMTIPLSPESSVQNMAGKQLRGKLASVRAGYIIDGNPVADMLYQGVVSDMSWDGNKYSLVIQDDLDIIDVKIPRVKAGNAWSGATAYSIGDIVVYGIKSYKALSANTGAQPDISPATWQDNGTVWQDIVYTTLTSPDFPLDWHLADIYKDIQINHVNIPTQRLDLQSLADIKASNPNIRGSRIITKPQSAIALLTELAWLLDSQTVMRQGKVSLMREPSGLPVGTINDNNIKDGLRYRRGWKDLKNECLILSGYSGDGEGDEQYFQSYVYADTISIADYQMTGLEVFKDKWSVSSTELEARAAQYVSRWKDGRRVISITAHLSLMKYEVGDIVTFSSVQMPPHDNGALNYIIIRRDLDWIRQTLKFTLMES